MINLSVVIPSFNEKENIKKGVLEWVSDFLSKQKYLYEVIIVDDGSTDGTVDLAQEFIAGNKNFRLIKNTHGGKAIAVMTGLLQSKGEVGLFIDMDQATPISEVEKILPYFDKGFDIVIGSRQGRKGAPIIRKLMALGFSVLRTLILGLPFKDTQCGFKAFSRKSIEVIFPILKERWKKHLSEKSAAVNAAFDVEVLFLAQKKNFKIKEVGVSWHHVGTERVQVLKDSIDAVIDIIKIRTNDLLNNY
jgi:glycosyltransferase involved in cell wall biosynthesis